MVRTKVERKLCCVADAPAREPYKATGPTWTSTRCENGHELVATRIGVMGEDKHSITYFCSGCKGRAVAGQVVMMCRACGFHLCDNCSGRTGEEPGQAGESEELQAIPPGERSKLFSEAVRALEIAKEKRMMLRFDEKSVVHAIGDSDQDLEGFDLPANPVSFATMQYTPLEAEELKDVWNSLKNRELPSYRIAHALIRQTHDHLQDQCTTCVRVPTPSERLIVVGDLHGHAGDFWHINTHYGRPSADNMFLFNGDFVDRGIWGPEVLFALFVLRLMYPEYVFLNRGNHESEMCTKVYGFQTHMACAYPMHHEQLYGLIDTCFNMLPLCHIVGEKVFVVHGGLPEKIPTIADIDNLARGPMPYPAKTKEEELFVALLWSDPREKSEASDRGIGWHFSGVQSANFCKANGFYFIVRSHEVVDSGFQTQHDGWVKTVFSASNYDETNSANVLILDNVLRATPGDEWSEDYIPKAWAQEAFESHGEEAMSALESAGGDFHEWTVKIVKDDDAKPWGIGVHDDNPNLKIPVIFFIGDGLVSDHNEANPKEAIKIGDGMLGINGLVGRDAMISMKESGVVNLRLRRPQTVHATLKAREFASLEQPPSILFPEIGLPFAATNGAL